MPLSRLGVAEIARAAEALHIRLDVVSAEPLAGGHHGAGGPTELLAARLIAAGATLHAPALVVHRDGRFLGSAILGYKEADAYASLIEERLAGGFVEAEAGLAPGASPGRAPASWRDYPVPGQPGAYFRWVPGGNAVAYEAGARVSLLELESGERLAAPGYVDFVPTPDGRFFVTPARDRALDFYDAEEVFEAARAGRGASVAPFHSDRQMRDQYPSVGILSSEAAAGGGTRTVYRVLTSWFDRVAFRDYEITTDGSGRHRVRPIAAPVVACTGYRFSIPILAQDGREVAGRDEASATTKVFRLADDGRCEEAVDVGLPTGKVAWDRDGRRLAFAIPEGAVRDGSRILWRGESAPQLAGVFVFDRSDGSLTRVEGSEDARRLTFPEFVGRDQVLFLLPQEPRGGQSRFRLVCCLP
jgi:hypothetical protein